MKIGHTFLRRGQRYWFVGEREHWTRDSRRLMLLVFQSHCADCGASFECRTTKSTFRLGGTLNRRCKRHHAQGVPVAKRAPKRLASVKAPKPARRPWLTAPTPPPARVAVAEPSFLD